MLSIEFKFTEFLLRPPEMTKIIFNPDRDQFSLYKNSVNFIQ